MTKEIDLDDVPKTPGGANFDFKAVKEFEYVRYCDDVKFKTKAFIPADSPQVYSDNEVDLNSLQNDDEKLQAIINSPMVEVRKRKSFPSLTPEALGVVRINPERKDLKETSLGSLNNYKQSKRNSIVTIQNLSVQMNTDKNLESNENVENAENSLMDTEINLLVQAVSDSETLLDNERKRLGDMVTDWKDILRIESKDMIPETQGDIESAVGRLHILLENRFLSTQELLQSAKDYVNGIKSKDEDKDYRAGDIYGFVDILISEVRKLDKEFEKLLKIRNSNWVLSSPSYVKRVKSIRKPKILSNNLKAVKSRINLKSLRAAFRKKNENSNNADSDLQNTLPKESENEETCDSESAIKTPASLLKRGIRLKSVIQSTTGTPVHSDTPRPRRTCRVNSIGGEFAVPSASIAISKKITRKRSHDNSPTAQPNLIRRRSTNKKDK